MTTGRLWACTILFWKQATRPLVTALTISAGFTACLSGPASAVESLDPGDYQWTAQFDVSFVDGFVSGDLYGLSPGATHITISGLASCFSDRCLASTQYPSPSGFSYSGVGTGTFQFSGGDNGAYSGLEIRWDSAGNLISGGGGGDDPNYYVRSETGSYYNSDYPTQPIAASTSLLFTVFDTSTVKVATTIAADAFTWVFTGLTGSDSSLFYSQQRDDVGYGGQQNDVFEFFDIKSAVLTLKTVISPPPVDAPPPTVEDLSTMSKAIYSGPFHLPEGYDSIDSIGDRSGTTAFAEAYYREGENGGRGQLVIAIKGTTSSEDWIARNRSFVGLGENDIDQSMELIAQFVTDLLKDPRFATADLTFTGHSLGGAMAEVLAKAAGADAVAFNAPGTSEIGGSIRSTLADELTSAQGHSVTDDILNIRQYGDLVSLVGTQEYSVETVRIANESLIDVAPLACLYSCHSMDNLDQAIQAGAERTPGIVSPLDTGGAVNLPLNLADAALTKAFNLIVNKGDIEWFDPTLSGNILQIDMNGSEARLAGLYLAGFDGSYPIEGFIGGSWQLLGEADPFSLFEVPDLELYRILNASGLVDDSGHYLVGLKFANEGTFRGTMGSPDAGSVPEPATWALFLLGFGVVGARMRAQRRKAAERGSERYLPPVQILSVPPVQF